MRVLRSVLPVAIIPVLFLGGASYLAIPKTDTVPVGGPKVLLIGDSIAGGKGDSTAQRGISGRLPQILSGAKVEVVSLPGATTTGLLSYLQHQLDPQRDTELKSYLRNTDVVILSAGLNDFWAETGPRRSVANLRLMAKMIACAGKGINGRSHHTLLTTLIPTTLSAQQTWADSVNTLLVGLPPSLSVTGPMFHRMEPTLLSSDGLHPSERGYDWLTGHAASSISRLIRLPAPEAIDCSAPSAIPAHDGLPNQAKGRKNRRPSVPATTETGAAASKRIEAKEVGLAYFSLLSPRFPCDRALSVFEAGVRPVLATLWGTFGDDTSCLARWFQTSPEKSHTLEIHPWNGPCIRNKRCESHELGAGLSTKEFNRKLEQGDEQLTRAITERVREIKAAVEKFARPADELILSTGLEDNYSPAAFERVLRLVKESWPHSVVRNPVGDLKKKGYAGADYLELHGSEPQFSSDDRCIANLDGTDMHFPHRSGLGPDAISWQKANEYVKRYSQRCRLTFVWSGAWQGLFGGQFQPPSARTFRVDEQDLRQVREMLSEFA